MGKAKTSPETVRKIIECLKAGMKLKETAERNHVCIDTVDRIRKRENLGPSALKVRKSGIPKEDWEAWDKFVNSVIRRKTANE